MGDRTLMKLLPRLLVPESVVARGGFSAAAAHLGLGKGVVSHHIAALERALGVRLVARSSRRIALTEAGEQVQERLARAMPELRDAVGETEHHGSRPAGLLRVTAPIDFGRMLLAPAIAAFRRRHPDVAIETVLDDDVIDMISERIDVSIRVGWPRDSQLVSRRLGELEDVLVAAPSYLRGAPPLREPGDLDQHAWLRHAPMARRERLSLEHADGRRAEARLRPVVTVNVGGMLVTLAAAGAGFAIVPRFMAAPELSRGELVLLLPGWSLPRGDIVAMYPSRRGLAPKVRAFVDFLAEWVPGQLPGAPRPARGRTRAGSRG